jgi:hypothetical protein
MKASIRARRADFAEERRQYYLRLVHRNPSLARFLGGWLNRIASYTQ